MDEMQTLRQQRPRQVEACSIESQLGAGAPAYILKNTTARRYMKLSEEGLFLWQLIDGQHTIRDLCSLYIERFQRPSADEVLRALARLLEAGFVTFEGTPHDDRVPSFKQASWLRRLPSLCIRYYSLPDVDAQVTALYRRLHPLFTTFAQAALFILASAGAVAFACHCATSPTAPANSLQPSFLIWAASLILHVVVHEAMHALTCKHFGRAVHRAGIGWYYFAPVAFVDTSEIWPAPRSQRVLVSAAGPYSNLVLAGMTALAALLPGLDGVGQVLFSFSTTGYILALVNLNPLLELDGYYILTDLLEMPNLRSRALAYLGAVRRGRANAQPRLHRLFILFGAASLAYGVVLGFGMLFAYRALIGDAAAAWLPQPYAAAIGWGAAACMSLLVFCVLLDGLRLKQEQP
jgi:putative peptide zinc metalloprotease protein